MKFPSNRKTILVCVLAASSFLKAEPLDEQLIFTPWTGGTFKSEWPGVAGRTYFYQWSLDLITWHYAPFMAFSDGGHEYFMDSSPSKLFLRLHRVDDATITSLQMAKDTDFDGDGLSNFSEVMTFSTFPTRWDTDGDLIPDGLEVSLNTSPILNTSTTDSDSDGMNNVEEYLCGRNLSNADPVSDTSSRALDVFSLSSF